MTEESKTNLVIIIGMSGAGKTSASEKLEDLGYYVIDNLPYELFINFLPMISKMSMPKVALTINFNEENKDTFLQTFNLLKENDQFHIDIFYFYANHDILSRRYKETRRTHPLATSKIDIRQAIELEEKILHSCMQLANHQINTSNLKVADLKNLVAKKLEHTGNKFKIILTSFGFKFGPPSDAEIVFDVRFLPNPFYIEGLKAKTGLDNDVYDYVFSFPKSQELASKLKDLTSFCIEQYLKEGRSEVVIAIGCTGGQHRSVSFVRWLEKEIANPKTQVIVKHREHGAWHA